MAGILELELYIVRHGESMGNIQRTPEIKDEDLKDPVLTIKGKKQATALGEYFKKTHIDHILSSGLNRALETATAVASRQTPLLPVEVHPIFTECDTPYDGHVKEFKEIKENFSLAKKAEGTEEYKDFIFRNPAPTDQENMERAKEAIIYLRNRFNQGEKVMVIAHAAFATNMVFAALGMDSYPEFDIAFTNTGVTKLVFYKPGTGSFGWDVHLIYHNDHSHLNAAFPGLSIEEK